ncbi:hypothetical protein O6H91_03G096100 [Diphasiastrum complanatum]|uniref:Uncharacterized protein n=2 Tax=Diphasiastrum complanatum TaxID=34168 RepID=A0ACC2E9I8_DIPCM|nr:hypothetical protein O6H91_03G096100 [Diphasiastrum complanatum]
MVEGAATMLDMKCQSDFCHTQLIPRLGFGLGELFPVGALCFPFISLQLEGSRVPLRLRSSSKPALCALRPGKMQRSAVFWNRQIQKHIEYGEDAKALKLYQEMERQGVQAQTYTFASVLKACANLGAIAEGRRIHEQIRHNQWESDIVLGNSLVEMYSKSGSIENAWDVFKNMPVRDVISWNAMIFGYVRCGQEANALDLYERMQQEHVEPNCFTFVGVLKACGSIAALEQGKQAHSEVIQRRLESNVFIGSCLVAMYAKCGELEDAFKVFNQMRARDVVVWNTMIMGFVKCKQTEKAFELFQEMRLEMTEPDCITYLTLFDACASTGALEAARYVHAQLVQSELISNIALKRSLINVYAKCGCMEDAWELFNSIPVCTVVLWNTLIVGYVKFGESMKALELFQQMQRENIEPDVVSFVSVLSGCANLVKAEEIRRIHAHVIQCGLETDTTIGSCLIDAYIKCSSLDDACRVFNNMTSSNVQLWNAMMAGYMTCGQGHKVHRLFRQMQLEDIVPGSGIFVNVLTANCTTLEEGRKIHARVVQCGLDADPAVGSALVRMYAKYGSIEDACKVFNKLPSEVGNWTAMIAGYVKCGLGPKALKLFQQMQLEQVQPSSHTLVAVLNACASLGLFKEGKQLHSEVLRSGLESDIVIGSSLIDMYVKCGIINDACRVFNNMPARNVVSWNALIAGYVTSGQAERALTLFQQFPKEELQPDSITFIGLLNACASLRALEDGRHIHSLVNQRKLESDVFVQCSLVDMYATCGSIEDASGVFNDMHVPDMVSWSAMIAGYVKTGQCEKAFNLYNQMTWQECLKPDSATFVSVLNACASVQDLDEGRRLHTQLLRYGLELDVFVGSSLVDMYAKCGEMQDACRVFHEMPERDVFSWNALITGYVKARLGKKALDLYHRMKQAHVVPDSVTFVGVLNACANAIALEEGRLIHEEVTHNGLLSDVVIGTCLVNMYAKCGSIEEAFKAFNLLPTHNVVCHNAMMMGYAIHGLGKEVLLLFEQMCRRNADMDNSTLVCLFSGLSHAGKLDEGHYYFESMVPVYDVESSVEHYSCMIDLLGRAGHLDEAENVIDNMPCQPDVSTWMALLGACKIHCNMNLGEFAAKQVLELEPENTSAYLLLSSLYAAVHKWDDSDDVWQMKQKRHMYTQPGSVYILTTQSGTQYEKEWAAWRNQRVKNEEKLHCGK